MINEEKRENQKMAEKMIAYLKGEYKFPEKTVENLYEEKHVVRRKPVSFFLELRKMGFKTKIIAQMCGLSEMKVWKILKEPNINKKYFVHEIKILPLMESNIKYAKKIVDENGHEMRYSDII